MMKQDDVTNSETPATDDGTPRSQEAAWRIRVREVIFEADTPLGKAFDIALLGAIVCSIIIVSLGTLRELDPRYRIILSICEWILTILFTVEYALRLLCVKRPARYATSFYGIVDFLSILPTYLQVFFPASASFAMVRSLRLLRIFRVLKLVRLVSEAEGLYRSFWEARAKIVVFFMTVLITISIMGTLMYEIEGDEPNTRFTSIPESMYWAIVTMTTVGYGDIVPTTTMGKCLSGVLILLGYSLIIVPTGFVSASLAQHARKQITTRTCRHCVSEGHDLDARFCKYCGEEL